MASMIRFAGPSAAIMLCAAGVSAAPNMKPGLWETSVRTEMAGMPMQMPPVTTRQCIREQDLVPQTNSSGQACAVLDQNISRNTVTWRIECKADNIHSTGKGKITYHGDTFQGQIDMTMQQQGMGPMTMSQKLEGKRLGDCQ